MGGGLNVYAGPLRVAHTSIISAVNATRVQSRPLHEAEARANAELIAKAPDMLIENERFRAALRLVEECSNDPQIVAHVSKVLHG